MGEVAGEVVDVVCEEDEYGKGVEDWVDEGSEETVDASARSWLTSVWSCLQFAR